MKKISIIIPVYNNFDLTLQCINSILKYCKEIDYEIIVSDDASTDETREFFNYQKQIIYRRNSYNQGFAYTCNRGAEIANGEYLLFLNNDTIPLENWLKYLIETMESDKNIAICGSKLLYPDDTIQHAGIKMINNFPEHINRGEPADCKDANILFEMDMVTGACMIVRKEIFFELGGFDITYSNGCEDIDFCLKAREKGYKVYYNPESVLYHYEGISEGRFDKVNENISIFKKRWKNYFNKNGFSIFDLRKIPIYIVGDFKQTSSLSLINNVLKKHFQAKRFNCINVPSIENIDNEKQGVVIFHSWPPKLNLNNKLNHFKKFIILPWEYEMIPKEWVEPLNKNFDEIWVPSYFVKKSLMSSGVINKKIVVIPNGFDPEIFNITPPKIQIFKTSKEVKFLFIGGAIWRKGIDILLEAYLKVFSNRDNVTLIIKDFGTNSFYKGQSYKEKILFLQKDSKNPEIIYIDKNLTFEEIADLYKNSTCLVLPYRGEGFALPVLESMACGKPAIVTKGGATDDFCKEDTSYFIDSMRIKFKFKELNLPEEKIYVNVPKVDSLAKLMVDVYQNINKAEQKGYNAYKYVYQKYRWDIITTKYIERILRYF